jgi:NAD(P)-dependent dehydrogenase (short-subunit alcohol dehydrogenase family)
MSIKGKNVLITGGSNGIGRSIALHMARAGANIIIVFRRDKQGAEEVIDEAHRLGVRAYAIQADTGVMEDIARIVPEAAERAGHIDILVNNAGICPFRSIFDITEDVFDRTVAVNLKGYFFIAQSVARHMVENNIKGRIINVSSISGIIGSETQVHYCTTKGGINTMTKALAVALARYGITVNAVLPGTISTNANTEQLADPETRDGILAHTPLKSLGEGRHIASAVEYFASDDADWTTGSLLVVDGGYIA